MTDIEHARHTKRTAKRSDRRVPADHRSRAMTAPGANETHRPIHRRLSPRPVTRLVAATSELVLSDRLTA